MDRITESLLESFIADEDLQALASNTAFEHFAAFSVLTPKLFEKLTLDDVSVGDDSTPGIDTVAIMVNGILVPTGDDLDAVLETNGALEVDFYFIQSKTSPHFDGALIGDFADEVRGFFTSAEVAQQLRAARDVTDRLLSSGSRLKRNPHCHLYYVTTGRWSDDPHLVRKVESAKSRVEDVNIFERVTFTPIDAQRLQRMYRATRNSISVKFTFSTKSTLPRIEGVAQSYLGALPGSEFLKIIADANGDLHRGIFEDNVRDFQGVNNPVNAKMHASIVANPDRFAVLNNGVTIVAKEGTVLGDEFTLSNFQIVNGCQTANVIYELRGSLTDLVVPLRIIMTEDEEITTSITAATNSQTQVSKEDLYSLLNFQRLLENFFTTFSDEKKLYYERRSQQYRAVSHVPRNRIVTRPQLVKAFASTFLDEPHRATRYYTTLYRTLGDRMFNDDHRLETYYASAVAQFRLEFLLRGALPKGNWRPVRYHILHAARHLALGAKLPPLNSSRQKTLANNLSDVLWDEDASTGLFSTATELIAHVAKGAEFTRDFTKQPSLVKDVARAAAAKRSSSTAEPWYL